MEYDRGQAFELLKKYNKKESLIKHALAVEAVMRRFARYYSEDEERWGIIGILHDIDYELYPEEHLQHAESMLKEGGYDEKDIRAVLSHGYKICSDIEPLENIEKTLFTIDELTGLVTAAVYMRPSRSIMDFEVKSLKKKWKDKAFAAGCNRETIQKGCEMMELSLDEVMQMTIEGMREAADALGLSGGLQ